MLSDDTNLGPLYPSLYCLYSSLYPPQLWPLLSPGSKLFHGGDYVLSSPQPQPLMLSAVHALVKDIHFDLEESIKTMTVNRWSTEHLGVVKLSYMMLWWSIHATICLSKPIESSTPRVNPNMHYGLKSIIICQYWLSIVINTAPRQDVKSRMNCVDKGRVYMGTQQFLHNFSVNCS